MFTGGNNNFGLFPVTWSPEGRISSLVDEFEFKLTVSKNLTGSFFALKCFLIIVHLSRVSYVKLIHFRLPWTTSKFKILQEQSLIERYSFWLRDSIQRIFCLEIFWNRFPTFQTTSLHLSDSPQSPELLAHLHLHPEPELVLIQSSHALSECHCTAWLKNLFILWSPDLPPQVFRLSYWFATYNTIRIGGSSHFRELPEAAK